MTTTRRMTCAVCGEDAGHWEQHWNRDTGFGLCAKSRDWLIGRGTTAEEMKDLYGIEGVNYPARERVPYLIRFRANNDHQEGQALFPGDAVRTWLRFYSPEHIASGFAAMDSTYVVKYEYPDATDVEFGTPQEAQAEYQRMQSTNPKESNNAR